MAQASGYRTPRYLTFKQALELGGNVRKGERGTRVYFVKAQFWHVSYGFRPGRGCHGALEHIRLTIRPRKRESDGRRHGTPYTWVIEGDIKGCLDAVS
jgi:N-terminal domain of anti-restriction factor ArdC